MHPFKVDLIWQIGRRKEEAKWMLRTFVYTISTNFNDCSFKDGMMRQLERKVKSQVKAVMLLTNSNL